MDLLIPTAHPKQNSFGISPAKRKVIVAGRRAGKTTGVAMLAVLEACVNKRRVLEAAPTADQTEVFWDACKEYLALPISKSYIYKHEGKHLLQMPHGGRIRTKTAWDADSLRGDYADLLILDEFPLMDPSAWDKVGAPMLLDNDGDAVFIGTPLRKNHFFHQYTRALGDDTGRWAAWHFTSHDNPHLSKAALAEITADMTEDAYKQEIMAEFLDNEGAVFRNIEACLYPGGDTPADHEGHELVMGVDWGKSEDYTVASVGCRQCKREVELDRFHGIEYRLQRQRLAALAEKWGTYDILAESNSMGEPNIEDMQYGSRVLRPDLIMVGDGHIVFVHHADGRKEGPFPFISEQGTFDHLPYSRGDCRYGKILSVANPENVDLTHEWHAGEYSAGLPVRGFATTGASKPPLIESLVLSFEREEVHFIDDPIATSELEAFEMSVTANNRPRYQAPQGLHDDTVMARALMNHALQLRGNWMALL